MTTIIILSIAILAAYITGMICKYGIPDSVSETFLLMPKKTRQLFTLFCFALGLLMAPVMFELSIDTFSRICSFFTVGGLLFVGAAAEYKQELTRTVHFIGAGAAIIGSQGWIFHNTGLWWVSLICLFVAAFFGVYIWFRTEGTAFRNRTALPPTNLLFWLEMAAFVSLLGSALIFNLTR